MCNCSLSGPPSLADLIGRHCINSNALMSISEPHVWESILRGNGRFGRSGTGWGNKSISSVKVCKCVSVCLCVYVDLGARACVHAHVYVYVCVWISTSGKPWDFYMQHILHAPRRSCPAFQICARVCVCVYVSVQRHY